MNGKTITASVGRGGANIPTDVATIQYLLNCVPAAHGGPLVELDIDGFAGVLTNQAITRFQQTRFGWSDAVIEPERTGGVTIAELKTYDPLPFSAPSCKPESASFENYSGGGKKQSGGGKRQTGSRPLTPEETGGLGWVHFPSHKQRGKSAGKKQTT